MTALQTTKPVESTATEHADGDTAYRLGGLVPITRIQRLIAERMAFSKKTKPCYYMGIEADTTELMDSRHALKKKLGVKITSNAFYIKALALAVRDFPLMVGAVDGDVIRVAGHISVGFAVNAPQGLVVPVVRDADKKALAEIAILEKTFIEKGRNNKLTLEEMEGETIGLSNLGVYGIDSFLGIVPPPASAILAVGNTVRTVVPEGDDCAIRKITSLTLAADSRVVNEFYAAGFLKCVEGLLKTPLSLI